MENKAVSANLLPRESRSRQNWKGGVGLSAKLGTAARQIRTSSPTLAELESLDLVPSERVSYDSAEFKIRIKLGLPLAPPNLRPGQWAYHHNGFNAKIVSVRWDRISHEWRGSFYGFGAPLSYISAAREEAPFVQYQALDSCCGQAVYPALNAEIARRLDERIGA